MNRKWCNSCARFLDASEFWRNSAMRDGLQEWCKSCLRAWRMANREIEREQDRARYARIRKRVMNAISRDIAGDTGE